MNENRLEFIPILVWTRVERGDERGRDDCGSIPHTLARVMLLHRWEKIARSVRIKTESGSSSFSLRELGVGMREGIMIVVRFHTRWIR